MPIGGAAKRLKEAEQAEMTAVSLRTENNSITSHLTDGIHTYPSHQNTWPTIAFQQAQPLTMHYPYAAHQRLFCKQELPDADASAQSYQDLHQLQLGNNYNTHNFFQLHNLMNLDSSSMEHSSGSNSVMYSNSSNYGIPMGITLAEGNQSQEFGENNDENPYGATDPYTARNLYYLSQQSSNSSACNNWNIPTAVPNLAPRTNSMALCHGAPAFTVWNDT